jgi:cobalamin biosynthesis protein CobT
LWAVLRLEQEIERFARNPKQQDLLLKPMASSYERLAAHRVAQHYGLQSMVVASLSPSTSRILLVKTSSECKLPSIRLMDIPSENATQEKSGLGEKFAIKKRENSASGAGSLHNSGEKGRFQMKSVEEREEEYDKARARIFSPNSDRSNPMDENNRVSNATSPKKEEENVSECSSDLQSFNIRSGEKSPSINSSRVAIFRDREKDMKDPDYNRNYKRYLDF